MEARPQATFIPKKPVTSIDTGSKGLGFLSLVSLIIFLATVIAAGGIYLYSKSLTNAVAERVKLLDDSKKAFDPEFISFIVRLNKRIEASKQLLNKHVAVSSVFKMLQDNTLKTVQFNSFTFAGTQAGNSPVLKLTLTGLAKDYNSLAAQAEFIGKVKTVRDQIFSNFTLTQDGKVAFSFDAVVDPGLVDYKARLSEGLFDINTDNIGDTNDKSDLFSTTTKTSTSTVINEKKP